MKSQIKANGKDVDKPTAQLTFNLADDILEVRGFGQPVTRAKAKEMATAYFDDIEAAETIVKEIDSNPDYKNLKKKKEFAKLKSLIDPASQTVSGVFGKEIILQILSMRGCEGIRYIYGKDEGKNTIILIGVQDAGVEKDDQGVKRAFSIPVEMKMSSTPTPADAPIDGEVHRASLNIEGIRKTLSFNNKPQETKTDILFGKY